MTEKRFLGRQEITADARRLQAMFGTLYAGGGTVKLDANGIEIIASDAFADSRSYKFVADDDGDIVARLGAVHDDGVLDYRSVDMRTLPHAGLDGVVWVVAESPDNTIAQVNLWASHDVDDTDHEAWLYCTTDAAHVGVIGFVIDGGWMGEIQAEHVYFGLDDNVAAGDDVRLQADWEVTYVASRRDSKTNITDYTADRAKFAQLKPSRYNAITAPDATPMVGLIAEDVDEVFPDLVIRQGPKPTDPRKKDQEPKQAAEPKISSWDNRQMQIMMISMIQQQERDIEALKARVAALEAR